MNTSETRQRVAAIHRVWARQFQQLAGELHDVILNSTALRGGEAEHLRNLLESVRHDILHAMVHHSFAFASIDAEVVAESPIVISNHATKRNADVVHSSTMPRAS